MFSTVVIGLLLIAALAIFIVRPSYVTKQAKHDYRGELVSPEVRQRLWWAGFAPLALALIWLAIASSAIVEAKQVGVKTTFGKPHETTLSSGFHWKAPWQKVTSIDATVQTDEYRGDDCIRVRIGDGNAACVYATNRWSVNDKNAATVYAEFRSDDPTDSLRKAVVSTQFKAALNATFGTYDPTSQLEGAADEKTVTFAPDYNALAEDVEQIMAEKVRGLVDIDSVTISYLKLDAKTEKRIADYQAELQKTKIAKQAQATAAEQAKANQMLADSVSKDPNVLVAQCLQALAEGSFKPPAGFSCWPSGGSAVVVPSSKP